MPYKRNYFAWIRLRQLYKKNFLRNYKKIFLATIKKFLLNNKQIFFETIKNFLLQL